MKKILILLSLSLSISNAHAQWQEITKYGPVKDFLYIDSNLQYVWGDTNYIVENGQARMVADFGFKKKNRDGIYYSEQVDFVKGTRIGYLGKIRYAPTGLDVFRTNDGGLTWHKYASADYPKYDLMDVIPIAIDSEKVLFTGRYTIGIPPDQETGQLPIIKVYKKIISSIYPKLFFEGKWITTDSVGYATISRLYFIDTLYGIGILEGGIFTNGELVRTTNGGNNFTFLDISRLSTLAGGTFIPINQKTIYSIGQYGFSESSDSGFNWVIIKINNIGINKTDTLFSSISFINDQFFYLKGNILKIPQQTVSYIYNKNLIDQYFDSVEIKPVKCIECYDNTRCYMYGPSFYQNFNPIAHPLTEKEINKKQVTKPKLIYNADQIELLLPPSEQNNQFQLMLFDMSGKLIFTDNIPKQSANYKLRLTDSLPQGLYILRLCDNVKVFCLKFLR